MHSAEIETQLVNVIKWYIPRSHDLSVLNNKFN